MPKLPHEALVQLIRSAPGMVVDLLRPLLGGLPTGPVEVLPQVTAAELVNLDLAERRADVVLLLGDPQRPDEAFVVEAQRRSGPAQAPGLAVLRDRLRGPLRLPRHAGGVHARRGGRGLV
jgi:hypothetical protein